MARLCRRVILITRLNQFAIFLGGKAIKDYNFISFLEKQRSKTKKRKGIH